eukprot:m51a1_g5634 hypothetical protein (647) ;mRNA; f:827903-829843
MEFEALGIESAQYKEKIAEAELQLAKAREELAEAKTARADAEQESAAQEEEKSLTEELKAALEMAKANLEKEQMERTAAEAQCESLRALSEKAGADLVEERAQLESALETAKECETLRAENAQYKTGLAEAEQQLSKAREEIIAAQAARAEAELKSTATVEETASATASAELKAAQDSLVEANSRAEKELAARAAAEGQCVSLRALAEKAEADLIAERAQLKAALEIVQEENDALKKASSEELEKAKTSLTTLQHLFKEECSRAQEDRGELQGQLAAAQSSAKKLEEELTKLKAEKEAVSSNTELLTKQLEEMRQRAQSLEHEHKELSDSKVAEVAKLTAEYTLARQQAVELEARLNTLQTSYGELKVHFEEAEAKSRACTPPPQGQLQAACAECATLRQSLALAEEARQAAETRLTKEMDMVQNLLSQLAVSEASRADLSTRSEELSVLSALKSEASAKTQTDEASSLRSSAEQANSLLSEGESFGGTDPLHARVEELEAQLASEQRAMNSLRLELYEAQSMRTALEAQLAALCDTVASHKQLTEEVAKLKQALADAQASLSACEGQVTALRAQVAEATGVRESMTKELDRLRAELEQARVAESPKLKPFGGRVEQASLLQGDVEMQMHGAPRSERRRRKWCTIS